MNLGRVRTPGMIRRPNDSAVRAVSVRAVSVEPRYWIF